MADTTAVRYYQDKEETQGPYLVEFDTREPAQTFIDSIGTGTIVEPEPEEVDTPDEPVVPPLTVEGDNSPADGSGTGQSNTSTAL